MGEDSDADQEIPQVRGMSKALAVEGATEGLALAVAVAVAVEAWATPDRLATPAQMQTLLQLTALPFLREPRIR
jgi:hypothetical protein